MILEAILQIPSCLRHAHGTLVSYMNDWCLMQKSPDRSPHVWKENQSDIEKKPSCRSGVLPRARINKPSSDIKCILNMLLSEDAGLLQWFCIACADLVCPRFSHVWNEQFLNFRNEGVLVWKGDLPVYESVGLCLLFCPVKGVFYLACGVCGCDGECWGCCWGSQSKPDRWLSQVGKLDAWEGGRSHSFHISPFGTCWMFHFLHGPLSNRLFLKM